MRFFIDKDKDPTVYTNLFGKKVRRDFNNARAAEKMEGRFKGRLTLVKQRSGSDDLDVYNYKYPGGGFGYAVNIYDDTVNSSLTPGRVVEAVEKVYPKVGKDPIKRVFISRGDYFQNSDAEALISKDIIIFDGRKKLSDEKVVEALYQYGICNLCDYTLRLNSSKKPSVYFEPVTDAQIANLFGKKEKEPLTIALTEGWFFDYITEELFEDRDISNPLECAKRIIKEMKECAAGEDFTFARRAVLYYKDINRARVEKREYYLVMKHLIKDDPLSGETRPVKTKEELDEIISDGNKLKPDSVNTPAAPHEGGRDRYIDATKVIGEEDLKD